jgi:hypothetical protein
MQPNDLGTPIGPAAMPRRARHPHERCKHDLLPGQCGFCPVTSPEPGGDLNGQEYMAWLGRFARPPESGLPAQHTDHESPQPGASAGSTANPAISRRRL